ncbi:bacterial regulatory protein, tetR family domain-containing protein [Ditylenchus destructor]|uniref:Bacterial regulatory protein, tetR family domain-containing protein n=1 Tax=Ditylenchus destructor TaxID=166010 RepID=A0AAD4MEQ9_9BILA|nr:bacterial regulatory protein, tetR family domain-containing protein [Ditylenchus destructor]
MARPRSEDKRNAILDAAIAEFASRGAWSTPTSAISRAAGVAEGTLFTYFANKEVLVNELYRQLKTELAEVMPQRDWPEQADPRRNTATSGTATFTGASTTREVQGGLAAQGVGPGERREQGRGHGAVPAAGGACQGVHQQRIDTRPAAAFPRRDAGRDGRDNDGLRRAGEEQERPRRLLRGRLRDLLARHRRRRLIPSSTHASPRRNHAMPKLKRRHFVLGTAGAVGALVVGWAATRSRRGSRGRSPCPRRRARSRSTAGSRWAATTRSR